MAITSILARVSALLDDLDLAVRSSKTLKQGIVPGDPREVTLGIFNRVSDLGVVVACHS